MRFWFDVLTPKQVNFFKPIIDELKRRKHSVLCTSRTYREVEELAALKGLEVTKVGRHGGDSLYGKLEASAERTSRLAGLVQDFQPDCLADFSSPEASRVAFGLRIRNVGFSDSPHAEAVCRLTVPLMDKLMCPWIIPPREFTRYGIARRQILHYRALDPAIWLKAGERGTIHTHGDLKLDPARKTIVFRPEESKAAYLSGGMPDSRRLLGSLVRSFRDCNVIVLCRYPDQLESIGKEFGDRAIVTDRVVDGTSLLQLSDLFIGSGGTMNCEAALLGVPNLTYAMRHILVNRFLFGKGISQGCRDASDMIRLARKMLYDERVRKTIRSKSERLLARMEDPKKKITRVLELNSDRRF